MPVSYTSVQPSYPRRHPTCWASSQRNHTIFRTPCHEAWTSAPLSAHPSNECCCTAPQIETPICTRRTTTHQLLWQQQHTCGAVGGSSMDAEGANNPTRLRTLIPDTGTHPPEMTLPRTAWVRINRLRTGVGRFRSCLYEWGMASSAACECGAEEQTVDHVVFQCPIHRPRNGFRERGALGHLSFGCPKQMWRVWPFVWKAWKYAPLMCAPQTSIFCCAWLWFYICFRCSTEIKAFPTFY